MLNSEKIKEWVSSVTDSMSEQLWYQELKGKWEELDAQSRTYLKFSGVGLGILTVLFVFISSIWNVYRLKNELSEKRALLGMLQSANDELRRLKDLTPSSRNPEKDSLSWQAYFESVAGGSGIDKASVSLLPEKAGPSGEQSKETLMDVSLNHINIKQILRFMLALESGQRPVKVRNLLIDTKNDPTGYLDATLAVSGFTLMEPKE